MKRHRNNGGNGRRPNRAAALEAVDRAGLRLRKQDSLFEGVTRDEIIARIKKTREELLKERAIKMKIPKSKIPVRSGRHIDAAGARAVMAEIWKEIKEQGWRIRGLSDREIMARAKATRYKLFEAEVAAGS